MSALLREIEFSHDGRDFVAEVTADPSLVTRLICIRDAETDRDMWDDASYGGYFDLCIAAQRAIDVARERNWERRQEEAAQS